MSENIKLELSEFDQYADEYYNQHSNNISISGESPDFFSEYKIKDMAAALSHESMLNKVILDFGCGIGNSIPYIQKYFPTSKHIFTDVSQRSLDIAAQRFPSAESRLTLIKNDVIPLAGNSVDVVFTACVFHHINHSAHTYWLSELKRIVKPNGYIFIFEHNPYNPLTVRAVNTCAFDVNAKIIKAQQLKKNILKSGWIQTSITYRIFFPRLLSKLRFLEAYIKRIPLGAQYFIMARK